MASTSQYCTYTPEKYPGAHVVWLDENMGYVSTHSGARTLLPPITFLLNEELHLPLPKQGQELNFHGSPIKRMPTFPRMPQHEQDERKIKPFKLAYILNEAEEDASSSSTATIGSTASSSSGSTPPITPPSSSSAPAMAFKCLSSGESEEFYHFWEARSEFPFCPVAALPARDALIRWASSVAEPANANAKRGTKRLHCLSSAEEPAFYEELERRQRRRKFRFPSFGNTGAVDRKGKGKAREM